jgi:hypothetical protein
MLFTSPFLRVEAPSVTPNRACTIPKRVRRVEASAGLVKSNKSLAQRGHFADLFWSRFPLNFDLEAPLPLIRGRHYCRTYGHHSSVPANCIRNMLSLCGHPNPDLVAVFTLSLA